MLRTRRRTLFVAALVTAIAATLAVAAAASHATYNGKNGRIAFRRYFDDDHHLSAIFTINPDGSGQARITRPPKGFVDDQPDWSPDGKLLAFTRCVLDHLCSVYVVDADGTNLRRISPPCPGNAEPPKCEDDANVTFLPDGKHVAYTRSTGNVRHWRDWDQIQHSDVVVSDLAGRYRRVVLRSGEYRGDLDFAYFSPDGKRFVYERANSPLSKPALHRALFVASSDGSDDHRITPWALDAGDNPDWSPGGNWILFRTHEDADRNTNIAIVHPDGSGFRQLTHFSGQVNMRSATFSPDGQSIVFASDLAKGRNPSVYTMRLDGTHVQLVTHSKLWDSAVDWGPSR
jgi:Tol biopolymer transport system component